LIAFEKNLSSWVKGKRDEVRTDSKP
jgi:hypothetical protein